jgi:superfamily II DNA/RNA helicase
MEDNNYMQSVVDSWISLPESANLITNIYNKILVNSGICFIPVFTVQSGYELATNLFKLGIKPILWTAELSLQVIDGELSEGKLSLSDLKDIASKPDSFQILIATSIAVEGIDLKNLGSVIPLTGKSFKMLIQPVGRAARSDKVKLVLIWEKGNPILSSQMTHKFNHTKKSLNIDSLTKLNLEDFT